MIRQFIIFSALILAAFLPCSCKKVEITGAITGSCTYTIQAEKHGYSDSGVIPWSDGETLYVKDQYLGTSAVFTYRNGAWEKVTEGKGEWKNNLRVHAISLNAPGQGVCGYDTCSDLEGQCVVDGSNVSFKFSVKPIYSKVRIYGLPHGESLRIRGVRVSQGAAFSNKDIIPQITTEEDATLKDGGTTLELYALPLGKEFTTFISIGGVDYIGTAVDEVLPGKETAMIFSGFGIYQQPTSFALDSRDMILSLGQSTTVNYTVTPGVYGVEVPVTAISSDPTVVSVSEDDPREITAVGPGEATVTYTLCDGSGLSSDMKVTVSPYIITYSDEGEDGHIHAYDTPGGGLYRYPGFSSTLWVVDAYGRNEVNDVTWSSSSSWAKVDKDGGLTLSAGVQVREFGAEPCVWYGEADITAKDRNGKYLATIKVIANSCGIVFHDEDGKMLGRLSSKKQDGAYTGTFRTNYLGCYAALQYFNGEDYSLVPAEYYTLLSSDTSIIKFSASESGKKTFDRVHYLLEAPASGTVSVSYKPAASDADPVTIGKISR